MKAIRVVGAVIVDGKGQLLAAQRPFSENKYKSYKWEFPGGKIEKDESPEEALKREIREELDCDIEVGEKIGEIEYDYPDFKLIMSLYFCRLMDGSSPVVLEHNQIKWISPEEMDSLDWIEADYQILPLIQKRLGHDPQ